MLRELSSLFLYKKPKLPLLVRSGYNHPVQLEHVRNESLVNFGLIGAERAFSVDKNPEVISEL